MVTSFTMATRNWGINLDPGQVCDLFNSKGMFDQFGNFIISKINTVFPDVYFKSRIVTTVDPNPTAQKEDIHVSLGRIKTLIDLGQPVLINVDLVGQDKNADHWIVAWGYVEEAGYVIDLYMNDPAYGDSGLMSHRYGAVQQSVYGYASFVGQPTSFPDGTSARTSAIAQCGAKLAAARAGKNITQNVSEAFDVIYSS